MHGHTYPLYCYKCEEALDKNMPQEDYWVAIVPHNRQGVILCEQCQWDFEKYARGFFVDGEITHRMEFPNTLKEDNVKKTTP